MPLGSAAILPVRQAAAFARYAEEHGFESCWVHEAYWNRDALSFLGALAVGTDRLGLAAGCINPYTRHPVLVASSIATLDELSGGRAILGFGTGFPARLDEQGIAHDQPIAAMRESIALIRRLWLGEKVTCTGRSFSLKDVALTVRPPHSVPIYLAGWGRRMLRVAGEVCDGYLARALESPASCRRLIGAVRAAASAAGRDPEALDTAAYLLCAVSSDRTEAREAMRHDPFVVYQFAVIDEAVLRESGVDPQVKRRIAEPFWRGDLAAAREAVSDTLLDEFALAGRATDVIARLEAYAAAGVRLPILQPIATTAPEVRRIIEVGRDFARSTAAAGTPSAGADRTALGRRDA